MRHCSVRRLRHLRRSWREDVERQALALTGLLELSHELGSSVDLDGLDGEGHVGCDLVEETCGCLGGCAVEGFADRPFGDRVVGGEVFDRLGRGEIDVDGVDRGERLS